MEVDIKNVIFIPNVIAECEYFFVDEIACYIFNDLKNLGPRLLTLLIILYVTNWHVVKRNDCPRNQEIFITSFLRFT